MQQPQLTPFSSTLKCCIVSAKPTFYHQLTPETPRAAHLIPTTDDLTKTEPSLCPAQFDPRPTNREHIYTNPSLKPPKMKENDAIAVIIILLFLVLALIAFGIYRLVIMARRSMSVSSSSSGTGSSSEMIEESLRR